MFFGVKKNAIFLRKEKLKKIVIFKKIIPQFSMLPTIVRIRREKGEVVQDCDVYVGRRCSMGGWSLENSIWANPFSVKEHGLKKALKKYRKHVTENEELMSRIPELIGKQLGCWCTNSDSMEDEIVCHAQILRELVYNFLKDSIKGMFYGVAVGDTLGIPFEFYRGTTPKLEYDGLITRETISIQWQFATTTIDPGQVSDDTEMTIALIQSIVEAGKYDRDTTIMQYLSFVNTPNSMIGKNTRELMKGVKTIQGYQKRWDKVEDWESKQSNGTLMRCTPLALLKNWKKAAKRDAILTNNNPVNIECSRIYLKVIRRILLGEKVDMKGLEEECEIEEIKNAIRDARKKVIRTINVKENKGWVVSALYCALFVLRQAESFESGMDLIMETFGIGTDSDTIMAVTGGLLGVKFGFENMNSEEKTKTNIRRLNRYFENTERSLKLTDDLIDRYCATVLK